MEIAEGRTILFVTSHGPFRGKSPGKFRLPENTLPSAFEDFLLADYACIHWIVSIEKFAKIESQHSKSESFDLVKVFSEDSSHRMPRSAQSKAEKKFKDSEMEAFSGFSNYIIQMIIVLI